MLILVWQAVVSCSRTGGDERASLRSEETFQATTPKPSIQASRKSKPYERLIQRAEMESDTAGRRSIWRQVFDVYIIPFPHIDQGIEEVRQLISDDALRSEFMEVCLARWALTDPVAAVASAEASQGLIEDTPLRSELLERWGESNPAEAMRWLSDNGVTDPSFTIREGLIRGLLDLEPRFAFSLIRESGDSEAGRELERRYMSRLAESDVGAAAAELLSRPMENWPIGHERGLAHIVRWARQAPEEVSVVVSELPAGEARSQAVLSAVEAWSSISPESTAVWVGSMSDESLQASSAELLVLSWSYQNVDATFSWLDSLPFGATRDAATLALCSRLGDIYPERLNVMANQIQNPVDRDLALRSLTMPDD